MKKKALLLLFLVSSGIASIAQPSAVDALQYGLVLDDPSIKNVSVKKDILFFQDATSKLHIDIYSPSNLRTDEKRPAVVFLNAIGDEPGQQKVKDWSIYKTWPQLMAAQGYIGISMECDGTRIPESIRELFNFLHTNASAYNINNDKLGVYAASANVSQSVTYLMSEAAYRGIKAAVLYYGRPPVGPFRKDLPVMFVVAEGDVNPDYNNLWSEVLKNNAPWTIKMATGMPHAFDAFSDNDEARKVIKETIWFWKNNLDNIQTSSWKYSKGRDVFGSLQMNRPRAMSLLKSLTEENPNDIATLVFYANQLREDENFDEAVAILKNVLAKDASNAQVMIDLAVLSYTRNEDQEGEKYVKYAIHTGKIKRSDYANLGFFLLEANKNKKAAYYYEKAIALSEDGFDYYFLARAYAKMNDPDNATRALERALILGYGSKQQINGDSNFDLIRSHEKFKRLMDALK